LGELMPGGLAVAPQSLDQLLSPHAA
jgi:hypothetical protein